MALKISTLCIGYGNPLRGDDAVGPMLAERLGERLAGRAGVRVISAHQLTPELAPLLAEAARVILLDAEAGVGAGVIRFRPVEPLAAPPEALAHQVTPGALAAAAAGLFGRAPELFVLGIGAGSTDLREGLTPAVAAALPPALDLLEDLIDNLVEWTPFEIQPAREAIAMHEHSLIEALIHRLEDLAREQGATRVVGVTVRLGLRSHFTPEHFREHYDRAALGTIAEGASVQCIMSDDPAADFADSILLESAELGLPD